MKIDKFGIYYYKTNNGNLHRIGLPAYNSIKDCNDNEWFFDYKRHRINGKSYPRYNFQDLYGKQINLNIDKLVL